MHSTEHLTLDDLILFMDREMGPEDVARAERHLLNCGRCARCLDDLNNASTAYKQYREQVLDAVLYVAAATSEWAPLNPKSGLEQPCRWAFWAAACACGLILAVIYWMYLRPPGVPNVQQILTRAATSPQPAARSLLLTGGKYRFVRPAVLESGDSEARFQEVPFQHVRALFIQANYSWKDPLSARSFADWRRTLRQKEDLVTAVREPGGGKFYRLQTRTAAGVLRSVSLTLQAGNYRATQAGFEFLGEAPLKVSEQNGPSQNLQERPQAPAPPRVHSKAAETAVTPEDELRVFAALDAIGADVEEPIDVKLDAQHHSVLVTGVGISATRRGEIETAIAALPNTVVRFSARQPASGNTAFASQRNSTADDGSFAFRHKLESRYGGVRELQAATDDALDSSSGLFAHTHSLLLLAREFPPTIEAGLSAAGGMRLLSLRQRHVGAVNFALRRLKEELLPLTTGASPPNSSSTASPGVTWQAGAQELFAGARNLDGLVSHLLSGVYTEQAGNEMLRQLPIELSLVEALVRAQSVTDNR